MPRPLCGHNFPVEFLLSLEFSFRVGVLGSLVLECTSFKLHICNAKECMTADVVHTETTTAIASSYTEQSYSWMLYKKTATTRSMHNRWTHRMG